MVPFKLPDDLPSFERPPVTEVVLSIQFASIPGFTTLHAGLLWQEFRQEYPKVSEQAPLGPAFETFGAGMPPAMPFRIGTFVVPPAPRYWFESEHGVHLLQLQQDRLIHNWRKLTSEDVYPRYPSIRETFYRELGIVSAFLARENLGPIQPNQCEVTYTNIIVLPDGANPVTHVERITPLWGGWNHDEDLAPLESATLNCRYVMRVSDATICRVYTDIQPAILVADGSAALRMDILVRGKPPEPTVEGAFWLLDAARCGVVRTFDRVTTDEMHVVWGKNNVG
jgi:uncharacterized protein (TIGR04255 family)